MSIYYGTSSAIGNIFPDKIGDLLPFNAVSLAAVAVCDEYTIWTLADCRLLQLNCSLVEVQDSTKYVQFSTKPTHKGLQQALVALMDKLDALPDHGPKLHKLLCKFASHGK